MHDQIRDHGRHIVYEENCRFPGKRSRVWNREEALNLLRNKQASEEIEALSLSYCDQSDGSGYTFNDEYTFTDEELQSLRSLRFLQGKGLNFVGNFKDHCELRWLSWHQCPPTFTATNFCLVNLAVLDLSRSKIIEDWTRWNQIKV